MNIKQELEKLTQKHNVTIEQLAPLISAHPERLQKRFEQDNIRFSDAQKILDILGYNIIFTKDYLK